MHSAVAELYRVFKPYRLGDDFAGCECCVAVHDSDHLASIPLRELSVSDLDRYAFKAMTTWGTDRDFKHFLPRLLELSLDQYTSFGYPEVLLRKLAYAKWEAWAPLEQDAIRVFLQCFWNHQLSCYDDGLGDERIRMVLGGLAEACKSLKPFLGIWGDAKTEASAMNLSQLINGSADEIMEEGRMHLWGNPELQSMEVTEWLGTSHPLEALIPFRDKILKTFPYVLDQLDGIRTAISGDGD